MKEKLKIGIIFGGKSAEHEVSLQSAKNVIAALDKNKYDPVLIGINKAGGWEMHDGAYYLLNEENPKLIALNPASANAIGLTPGELSRQLVDLSKNHHGQKLDVVFPVLHGTNGEDGTMQGLLKIMDLPFVGPGVLGSAVGMDKDVAKRLWRDAGIPIAKFVILKKSQKNKISFTGIKKQLGLPLFVKPANAGSSVGVSKVKSENDFKKAIAAAFQFDNKILVEEFIKGREIEVAVLGNENPQASVPGEIIPHHEFYSYEAKYIDENGAAAKIPADLPKALVKKIQETAVKAFQVLECEGMSRVDFFVTANGKFYVNEINTIPGFTNISMYPKLWEASGINYSDLVDRLISLAMERHAREKGLKVSF
jgi:D-alanine-D-alanine ligase